jgi:RNA polymerase sigma-70 factor (ECF subfamily)
VVNQELSDEQLLVSARAGGRDALEQLLERHQAQVYRFGMRMCRHPEDAKDVLQDTLLAVARGVRDFRGASSLSTWLYTVARSFCIKKRRRSQFAPEAEHSLETDVEIEARHLPSPEKHPDEALDGKQVEHALEQAISSLEPIYREVLLLRDVEGLSAPEVAEVLGITIQAVKSRLHRARLSVREQVAPLLGVDLSRPAAEVGGCPDVLTLFSQHLEDEISADVCTEMERHLEQCGRCQGACDSLKRTLALCRNSAAAMEVPRSVQNSVRTALRSCLAEKG